MTVDSSGNLYGTTSAGGHGFGVAYELKPESDGNWQDVVLHSFEDSYDGEYPTSLILGPEGRLYGTAPGGATGDGVIFEIAQN